MILRINDEYFTFNIFKAMKYPSNNDTCFRIYVIDLVVDENFQDNNFLDPLNGCMAQSEDTKCDNEKIY